MKKIRLLIVFNNHWIDTLPKLVQLSQWFKKAVNLDIWTQETSFQNIPYTLYDHKDIQRWGIEPRWYNENIIPLATGYDIVLFIVAVKDWHTSNSARGWRTDNNEGMIELQIACDENESFTFVNTNGFNYISTTFFEYARHEICHALYMLTGQQDNTHTYWDEWQLEKVLDELNFSSRLSILQFIQQKINAIRYLLNRMSMNHIEKMAQAIQEHEGYFQGSRSFRNKNPGNLKFTPYTKQLGAITSDPDGFARFANIAQGIKALIQLITDAKNGLLKSYKPDMTLLQFFEVYAPDSDGNNSKSYAKRIAAKIGVNPNTQIKKLL